MSQNITNISRQGFLCDYIVLGILGIKMVLIWC